MSDSSSPGEIDFSEIMVDDETSMIMDQSPPALPSSSVNDSCETGQLLVLETSKLTIGIFNNIYIYNAISLHVQTLCLCTDYIAHPKLTPALFQLKHTAFNYILTYVKWYEQSLNNSTHCVGESLSIYYVHTLRFRF